MVTSTIPELPKSLLFPQLAVASLADFPSDLRVFSLDRRVCIPPILELLRSPEQVQVLCQVLPFQFADVGPVHLYVVVVFELSVWASALRTE